MELYFLWSIYVSSGKTWMKIVFGLDKLCLVLSKSDYGRDDWLNISLVFSYNASAYKK